MHEMVLNHRSGEVLNQPEMTYEDDAALILNCEDDAHDADDLFDELDDLDLDYGYERVLNSIEYDPSDVMPDSEPSYVNPLSPPSPQEVVRNSAQNPGPINIGAPGGLPEYVD